MTEVTMPTIPEILEIAVRYPTNMADAMFAACMEKAADGTSDSSDHPYREHAAEANLHASH